MIKIIFKLNVPDWQQTLPDGTPALGKLHPITILLFTYQYFLNQSWYFSKSFQIQDVIQTGTFMSNSHWLCWVCFLCCQDFLEHTNKQTFTTLGFIIIQFLQNVSCQKPFWDKARLSSLVNKRFGTLSASEPTIHKRVITIAITLWQKRCPFIFTCARTAF